GSGACAARGSGWLFAARWSEPSVRHAGCVHLVTGPAAIAFPEVAETLTRVLGRPVHYVDLTDEQLKTSLLASAQSEWQATALIELNTYARQGHASVVTDTVERVTGQAARSFEEWARDHIAALRP